MNILKKTLVACALIISVSAHAQDIKIGYIYSQEITVLLPEYAKAQADIQALDKQYSDEMQRTNGELQRKYQEYQAALQAGSLPPNIQERRQSEIQEMMGKSEKFQQDAYQQIQQKQKELLEPIVSKVESAMKEVGRTEGYTCIFDLSRTYIPFLNESQSTDITPKVKALLGIK